MGEDNNMISAAAVVVAALITTAASLLALIINILTNGSRFSKQLTHEKEMRSKDLFFTLKSEIYSECLIALDDCFWYLQNLHKDGAMDNAKPDCYCSSRLNCFSRISLVSSDELLALSVKVRNNFIQVGYEIHNFAIPIHDEYDLLKKYKKAWDSIDAESLGFRGEYDAGDISEEEYMEKLNKLMGSKTVIEGSKVDVENEIRKLEMKYIEKINSELGLMMKDLVEFKRLMRKELKF